MNLVMIRNNDKLKTIQTNVLLIDIAVLIEIIHEVKQSVGRNENMNNDHAENVDSNKSFSSNKALLLYLWGGLLLLYLENECETYYRSARWLTCCGAGSSRCKYSLGKQSTREHRWTSTAPYTYSSARRCSRLYTLSCLWLRKNRVLTRWYSSLWNSKQTCSPECPCFRQSFSSCLSNSWVSSLRSRWPRTCRGLQGSSSLSTQSSQESST